MASDEGQSAAGRPGRQSAWRAVLGNPDLRRVQLAFLGSAVGDWAYATAIIVWAYDAGGASAVGVWMGVRLVLGALTTPLGALLADRWPRKRLMMLTDGVRALLVTVAAVFVALDVLPLVVFVCATLASLLASPFLIAQRSLLPSLARTPAELSAANGVHSTIDSLAAFVGPALAAALLVATDVPVVLMANVLTFLWSLALVSRISTDGAPGRGGAGTDEARSGAESGADDPATEGFVKETLAGFVLIGRDRVLLLTTLQVSLQTVVAGALPVLLVVMADDILGSPDTGFGLLNAVIGVGSVVGGVLAIARASRPTLGRDLTVGVVMWSLPLLLVSLWPTGLSCLIAAALIGIANPLVDVNLDTILQRIAPDELLGRVFGAVESCFIATMAVGALLVPLLLQVTSLRTTLVVIAIPVGLLALVGLPAMIRFDARMVEPPGLALVRGLDLFAPLDPATTEQLARSLEERRYDRGDVLVREGEPSDLFYVVASGRVEVTQAGRVLREESVGEYFGEIGLLRDVPRTATVTALEPTVVVTLARAAFLEAVSGHRESGLVAEAVVRRRLGA
ncbi:MFS transporter [Nocardioides aestuarii]|uniref:MFS transporter n=1 Tax=Nocardioides aestuarii TaxID=252231 RepID=A0ABW4TPC9_9ACTN